MRLRTALMFGCLAWLGFHAMYDASAADQTIATPSVAVSSSRTLPANQKIYPDLPAAVANAISSVVAVQRVTGAHDQGITASGVILNDNQVLTAGHTVDGGDGALVCANTSVQSSGLLSASAATSSRVTYGGLKHTAAIDLAILTVEADSNFRALPQVELVQNLPQDGEEVFFVNYQPLADGKSRNPVKSDHHYPAVFGGIVLGMTPEGLAIAAGQGTSYGLDEETNVLRKGASGGAVFSKDGQLIGLSVASDSLQADRSATMIHTQFGIELPTGQYQVAVAQTVDSLVLTSIQSLIHMCR